MVDKPVDEHSSEEVLDAVESIYRASLAGNASIFAFAAHFADIYNGDAADACGALLPGMERGIRIGGAGTPIIREFAFEEFGARMQMGPVAIQHYVADALDTRHRLPRLWARVERLEVKVGYVRLVAQSTGHLSLEAAGLVDAAVAEYADGRISWGRFLSLVEAKIIEADPEAAAAREAEAAKAQFAPAGRTSEHGMKGFYLRSTTAVVARFDATVAYLAAALAALGDPDPEDLRRVKACAILANPGQAVGLLTAFAAHRASNPVKDPERPVESDEPDDPLTIHENDLHPAQNDAEESTGRHDAPTPLIKPPAVPAGRLQAGRRPVAVRLVQASADGHALSAPVPGHSHS